MARKFHSARLCFKLLPLHSSHIPYAANFSFKSKHAPQALTSPARTPASEVARAIVYVEASNRMVLSKVKREAEIEAPIEMYRP
jgi:hypothetical protein